GDGRSTERAGDGARLTDRELSSVDRKVAPPPPPSASQRRPLVQPPAANPAVRELLEQRRAAFRACLDPAAPNLTIVVRVARGTPTFELGAAGDRTDKVRVCVAAVIKTIKFPTTDAQASIELRK
nr:hypothetical protein [Deltaproteobacteria bacterium]